MSSSVSPHPKNAQKAGTAGVSAAAPEGFSVKFSLSTKLLVSILALLTVMIAFLIVSAIYLLKEDKRAYTYQSESTGVTLAGREFVNFNKHQFDTLKIVLGSAQLGPGQSKQNLDASQAAIQTTIQNQSDLLGVRVGFLDLSAKQWTLSTESFRESELQNQTIKLDRLKQIDFSTLSALVPDIKSNGFAFFNHSTPSEPPILGIVVADPQSLKGPESGVSPPIRVAIGFSSLKNFGSGLGALQITVVTRSGRLLFDSDPTAQFGANDLTRDPVFKNASESKVAAGVQEYRLGDRHYISSYIQPGLDLVVYSRVDWDRAIRATYELIIQFALLGGMAIGVGMIFTIIFSKTITRPIQRLYQATRQIAKGNFDLKMKVESQDEIGALTGSFNVMSKQISELIQSQADKIHLENEMMIASTVQQTLIPPPSFKNSDVYIRSHYQSATHCGGDWWGFFEIDRKICVMIADATGHGMPSALITASARSCFSVIQKIASENPEFSLSPAHLLSIANRVVFDASMGKIMMTFFVGVIDFETMKIRFASAGHNPPWLFKKTATGFDLESLVATGTRLGEARDLAEVEEKEKQIEPGDLLFLYTDGLIECKDASGKMYGKKRARKLLESVCSRGPDGLVDQLMKDFSGYTAGKALDDDVTISTLQFLKNPKNGLKKASPVEDSALEDSGGGNPG